MSKKIKSEEKTKDTRSIQEVDQDLERTRAELTDTVNQLVTRINPRENVKHAVNTAKGNLSSFASTAKEKTVDMVEKAKHKAAKLTASTDAEASGNDVTPGDLPHPPGTPEAEPTPSDMYSDTDASHEEYQDTSPASLVHAAKLGEPSALAVLAGLSTAVLGAGLLLLSRRRN